MSYLACKIPITNVVRLYKGHYSVSANVYGRLSHLVLSDGETWKVLKLFMSLQ